MGVAPLDFDLARLSRTPLPTAENQSADVISATAFTSSLSVTSLHHRLSTI